VAVTRRELFVRATALLLSRPGKGLCATCLAEAFGVRSKLLHETFVKIEQQPGFSRSFGRCAICDHDRIVFRAGPPPPARPAGSSRSD
jgi:hypothetical protein